MRCMVDDAVPDVLGGDWVQRALHLRPDAQGDPVATLVHRRDAGADRTRPAVLYVHGFVDYFFQTHVADALAERGYDLYALDLRDYGRSIRVGREPNDTRELAGYAEEIDAAVALVRAEHDRVVLLGHSTGGLIAALWAHARRGRGLVDAVVLNSRGWTCAGPGSSAPCSPGCSCTSSAGSPRASSSRTSVSSTARRCTPARAASGPTT